MTKTIQAVELARYLHIGYQRFSSWLKSGLLGNGYQEVGIGNPRLFGFVDICAAKICADVVLTLKVNEVARRTVRMFRQGFTSKQYEKWDILIDSNQPYWVKKGTGLSYTINDDDPEPKADTVILILASNIVADVRKHFPDLEN